MSTRPDVKPLLAHLPGWKQCQRYRLHTWCDVITDAAGHEVRIELEQGRLRFIGHWPQGQLPDNGIAISVRADRAAADVVTQFNRRFLPRYLERYAQLQKLADAEQERKLDTETTRRKVMKLAGVTASASGETLYGPECTRLYVQGPDSIKLECRGNFTLAQITRLLEALKG
jgi:hypothetical protein